MTTPSIKEALELKPCPFCGGSNIRIFVSSDWYYARCITCEAQIGGLERSAEKAANRWNTRPALATLSPPAGERREAIARLRGRALFLRNRGEVKSPDLMEQAAALLASGLAQDEAAIRADEREKCAKIAENPPKVEGRGHACVATSRSIAAVIRSARNGGGS